MQCRSPSTQASGAGITSADCSVAAAAAHEHVARRYSIADKVIRSRDVVEMNVGV